MLFPPSTYSRREILGKLQKLPLVHDFRSTYAYDNILYLAAGEVIKALSGREWEDFVKNGFLLRWVCRGVLPGIQNSGADQIFLLHMIG